MLLHLEKLFSYYKHRRVAVVLALLGTISPLAGLQKFYLGQPLWGIVYLVLWSTPIPKIASAIDLVWYMVQDLEQFEIQFNGSSDREFGSSSFIRVKATSKALKELDRLREDGLMTEYEFEQKRRQLLEKVV